MFPLVLAGVTWPANERNFGITLICSRVVSYPASIVPVEAVAVVSTCVVTLRGPGIPMLTSWSPKIFLQTLWAAGKSKGQLQRSRLLGGYVLEAASDSIIARR